MSEQDDIRPPEPDEAEDAPVEETKDDERGASVEETSEESFPASDPPAW